jgi:hypothetical protein
MMDTNGSPRCECGYPLTGLSSGQCPECGAIFDPARAAEAIKRAGSELRGLAGMSLLCSNFIIVLAGHGGGCLGAIVLAPLLGLMGGADVWGVLFWIATVLTWIGLVSVILAKTSLWSAVLLVASDVLIVALGCLLAWGGSDQPMWTLVSVIPSGVMAAISLAYVWRRWSRWPR